jgi:hypothetical protein
MPCTRSFSGHLAQNAIVGPAKGRAGRVISQQPKEKKKPHAVHTPEVKFISKGKARHLYEFGVKLRLVITPKQGLVVARPSAIPKPTRACISADQRPPLHAKNRR